MAQRPRRPGARRTRSAAVGATAFMLAVIAAAAPAGAPAGGPRAVRPPPLAELVPPNYRVVKLLRAKLTGGEVPEVAVASLGPPQGQLGLHPGDVQVFGYDPVAGRWIVLFDAQKVSTPGFSSSPATSNTFPASRFSGGRPAPLVDPRAELGVTKMVAASLLPGRGQQLVFTAYEEYGGSGTPGELVVVDFDGGVARLAYVWDGDGGATIRSIRGGRMDVVARYWTQADAHCCPVRSYRFTVARVGDRALSDVADRRPWLGVQVTATAPRFDSPLRIVSVVDGTPAAGRLRRGDYIVGVSPKRLLPSPQTTGNASLVDRISLLDAGQTVRLSVVRASQRITVAVRLGSLVDDSVWHASPPRSFQVLTV